MTHFRRGRIPEALESLARAASESGRHAAAVSGMVVVLIHAGRQTEALPLFDEMKERATRAEVLPYYFAEMYLALGKVDKALEYLRRSYELRIPDMAGLAVDPLFQSLHGHPEFEVMLQSLGLRPALLT
jgi:predicted Zn-dependent protease